MNKMFMKVITLALTFGAVVACGETSSIITSTPSGNPTTVTPTTQPQTVLTNDDFERGKTTFIDAKGNEKSLNMQTIYTNAGSPHLDSLETQRIMVVPFGFDDPSTVGIQTEANLERINKTFFATSEEIKDFSFRGKLDKISCKYFKLSSFTFFWPCCRACGIFIP